MTTYPNSVTQAAKDYDMDVNDVWNIYVDALNSGEFYEKLEQFIAERAANNQR